MFDTYGELLTEVQAWLTRRHPRQPGDSDFVHRQAVRAKALDALRGLLPAGSLSNVGIYGTGQSYEMLLLRMRSHPLPEARSYAAMMLEELRKVIPSFLQRVDRPERGGEWSSYLEQVRDDTARTVERLFPELVEPAASSDTGPTGAPSVDLVDFDPEGEDKVIAAICFPNTSAPEAEVLRRVRLLVRRRTAVTGAGVRGGPVQPSPPTGPGLRADLVSIRRGDRLRRVPGPATPPDVDHRMAAARPLARLRRAQRGGGGRRGQPVYGVVGAIP